MRQKTRGCGGGCFADGLRHGVRPLGGALAGCLLLASLCSAQTGAPAQADTPAQAAVLAAAQAPGGAAMQATRLLPNERVHLDGGLSHPAWQRAPVHRDFVEKAPTTGAAPPHETRVRVLFDEHALYVGVEALDPDPALIRAPLVRHDGVNRTQDFVAVYLDAIGSRQSAQFFRVNAAGSTADGMHTAADDSEDFAPDFDFDAATERTAQGYTAVFRIPFASLRFTTGNDGAGGADGSASPRGWRIMVARRVPREQFYLHTSVLIPREAPSFIANMQPLLGVAMPERHQFLTLRPSLTWRHQSQQAAGAAASSRNQLDATLDLKWRPLPELVVDATLNPDFSQLALDVPQLAGNTRFALEFPETRPFFFESSDLLRSPTAALYTRSFTAPRGGLRATWRGARLAGSAFAMDDRGGGNVLLPSAYGTDTAEQPASRAQVARVRGDSGALQWGGVAATRRYADDRGDNTVLGPDLAWQIDEAWRLRAQWLQSDTSAQPVGGQLARGAPTRGQRAYAKLWYQTQPFEAELAADVLGSGFRNDSGFVAQVGVQHLKGRLGRGWQGLGPFNEFWLNLDGDLVRDRTTGSLVSQDLYPGIYLAGAQNLEAWANVHAAALVRTGAGNALLHQSFLNTGLTWTPALWAPLLSSELQWGQVADVSANRVRPGGRFSLSLSTRLLPRLELEPSLGYAWLRQDGQRVYGEAAHQLLARWHFSPQQTLRAIVQYSALDRRAEAATGGQALVAGQRNASTTGSLTYAFRQSMGTVLYLGAARTRQGVLSPLETGVQAVSRGNEVFIKLQVDTDEVRRLY